MTLPADFAIRGFYFFKLELTNSSDRVGAYWHTFTGAGVDMFGSGTVVRPWGRLTKPMDIAKARAEAAFEFMNKMQIPFFCFHDVDIAPEGENLQRNGVQPSRARNRNPSLSQREEERKSVSFRVAFLPLKWPPG